MAAMLKAAWVIEQMEAWAPLGWAEEWDNVGLIIGSPGQPAQKILVALDVTEDVVNEAVSGGYDFIISHHPLIYNPLKRINADDPTGRKIITLIKNGIGVYCAHTNLDKATDGVNDCLAEKLGFENIEPLIKEEGLPPNIGLGRVGKLPKQMTLAQLAIHVKKSLRLRDVRYAGNPDTTVKTVGLCGGDGSGSRFLEAAAGKGCHAYITGDLRYHCVQEALEMGLSLLDITHYSGEALIVDAIVSRLRRPNLAEIQPTAISGQVFNSM